MRGTTNSLQELEQLVDRMWERFESQGAYPGDSLPVDVTESDDEFVVTADVPGCERDDLQVRLLDPDTLQIAMDRRETAERRDDHYVVQERRHRSASRTVELPAAVDESGVSASFRNGVLTVTLPRSAEQRTGTDIEISG